MKRKYLKKIKKIVFTYLPIIGVCVGMYYGYTELQNQNRTLAFLNISNQAFLATTSPVFVSMRTHTNNTVIPDGKYKLENGNFLGINVEFYNDGQNRIKNLSIKTYLALTTITDERNYINFFKTNAFIKTKGNDSITIIGLKKNYLLGKSVDDFLMSSIKISQEIGKKGVNISVPIGLSKNEHFLLHRNQMKLLIISTTYEDAISEKTLTKNFAFRFDETLAFTRSKGISLASKSTMDDLNLILSGENNIISMGNPNPNVN
jgi:hypothetical protein